MPHCIIEYSKVLTEDVSVPELMAAVFQAAVQSNLFTSIDIKIRAIAYDDFYAENADKFNVKPQRFIHVCCKILSGRTLEQRRSLSKIILKQLTKLEINSASISVEIVDMERESYNKQLS